jgi:hypothetical protein
VSSADIVGIDAGAVGDWFATLGVDFAGPLAFERIGLGQSNLTYLVQDQDGRRWVLRRPPLGRLLASAHDVAREARILTSAARRGRRPRSGEGTGGAATRPSRADTRRHRTDLLHLRHQRTAEGSETGTFD